MFQISSHVRYSEVDCNGNMTVDSIINYLQDSCMLQSDRVGLGFRDTEHTEGVWFLNSWQVEIVRCPKAYENIDVFTYPYKFKGILGSRYFEIKNDAGEILVKANSVWPYLDSKTHRPRKIDPIQIERYAPDDIVPDMDCSSRKIAIPEDFEALPPVAVKASQLDTNMHVNNCEYVRTFIDATGIIDIPKTVRAEYKNSAVLGDTFYPYIHKEGNVVIGDLRDACGKSYATIEYIF